MKAIVPKSIKERVIKQWLQAVSRDQIAKDNEIGAGTVTAIIKDANQEIPDIDLLREVALVLKKYRHHQPARTRDISAKAYELFSEGITPLQVAIALNIRQSQTTKYYGEYGKLKDLHRLDYTYKKKQMANYG